jgi:uncharacterized Tic20 family protein
MDQDSKNIAILNWVLTIFFGFIPGLVLYIVKADDNYIKEHAKEALNWSITAFIGYAIATVLTFILIGALLFPVIMICNLIFCILGALAASKGDNFKVPFAIRLIK